MLRELHDTVGGTLTALKMRLTNITLHETDTGKLREIEELVEIVEDCLEAIRGLTRAGRRSSVDRNDFAPAVRLAVLRFSAAHGVVARLDLRSEVPPVSSVVATQLVKILQEALTNVGRHARATNVAIRTELVDGDWKLTIRDDGTGIPDSALSGQVQAYGIEGMRERAERIGAAFRIAADTPRGTVISITVPIA
jgi:two-component system sensor histidine kinase UhpB